MRVVDEHEGIGLRGGLHVAAPRLWLNGDTRHGVGFLAAYDPRRRTRSRVLCTPTVAAMLGPGQGAPLAVAWGRPFRLGRLAVELLPAGSSVGAAVLRFWHQGRVFLDLGAGRLDTTPSAPALALEPCDVALVDASLATTSLSDVAGLRRWLLAAVAGFGPGACTVVCSQPTVALDILCLLEGMGPIYANRSLEALAGRGRAAGVRLPPLRRLPSTSPEGGVVLWAGPVLRPLDESPARDLPRLLVAPRADAADVAAVGAAGGIAFSRRASGLEVDAIVEASGAHEVIVWGAGAAALCARLGLGGLACWHLVEDAQLELV